MDIYDHAQEIGLDERRLSEGLGSPRMSSNTAISRRKRRDNVSDAPETKN
jgi:hypothetical protein